VRVAPSTPSAPVAPVKPLENQDIYLFFETTLFFISVIYKMMTDIKAKQALCNTPLGLL